MIAIADSARETLHQRPEPVRRHVRFALFDARSLAGCFEAPLIHQNANRESSRRQSSSCSMRSPESRPRIVRRVDGVSRDCHIWPDLLLILSAVPTRSQHRS